MARKLTVEQQRFFDNVTRAEVAGVTTNTSQDIKCAILAGLSYCNFNNGQIGNPKDNEYLIFLQDMLADKAIELGKYDEIKWVGFK